MERPTSWRVVQNDCNHLNSYVFFSIIVAPNDFYYQPVWIFNFNYIYDSSHKTKRFNDRSEIRKYEEAAKIRISTNVRYFFFSSELSSFVVEWCELSRYDIRESFMRIVVNKTIRTHVHVRVNKSARVKSSMSEWKESHSDIIAAGTLYITTKSRAMSPMTFESIRPHKYIHNYVFPSLEQMHSD